MIIAAGTLTTIWLGPWICESVEGENTCSALQFLCGIGGMRLVAGVVYLFDRFKNRPLETLKALLKKWIS